MKTVILLTGAIVLGLTIHAIAAPSDSKPKSRYAGAAYEKASAHEPHFGETTVWPKELEAPKTDYYRQKWAKRPLMVWTVRDKKAKVDARDPANWTIDGKLATSLPSKDTDVYFPEGSYVRLKQKRHRIHVRHLTVGAGVRVSKCLGIAPNGNVWIKEGGYVEQVGSFSGAKNVFIRNDNHDFRSHKSAFANKILFNKAPDSSVEIIGTMLAWDEMGFMSGKIIIGPGASLVPGNRSIQSVYSGAQLILMSGAKYHKRGNQPYDHDLVISGELLVGTTARPISRDCTMGLSFKTKGASGLTENTTVGAKGDFGMVVRKEGSLIVTSVDPTKARLVITWNGLSSSQHHGSDKLDPVQRKIDLVLQGKLKLDGLVLDCIRTGGVCVADRTISSSKHIFYGKKNQAPPEALFAPLPESIKAKLRFDAADVPKPYSQQSEKQRQAGDAVMN